MKMKKIPLCSYCVFDTQSENKHSLIINPDFLYQIIVFRAKDSFADWFDHYHREKPKPPTLAANPSFTEKVAYEQRTKQYQRDLERY
jgi:hypothetical protein